MDMVLTECFYSYNIRWKPLSLDTVPRQAKQF